MDSLSKALTFLAQRGGRIEFSDEASLDATEVYIRAGSKEATFFVTKHLHLEHYRTNLELQTLKVCRMLDHEVGG